MSLQQIKAHLLEAKNQIDLGNVEKARAQVDEALAIVDDLLREIAEALQLTGDGR